MGGAHPTGLSVMEYKPHTDDTLEHIYKYKSLAGDSLGHVESILIQNKLYFENPLKFNDPFECRPRYKMSVYRKEREAYIDRLQKSNSPGLNRSERREETKKILKKFSKFEMEKLLEDTLKETLNQVGVCSFSEVYDDILMWSHYADSHRGICIRFKASSITPFFGEAQKVNYDDKYPIIDTLNDSDGQKLKKILFTKSKHWEYEYEWRITKRQEERRLENYEFPREFLNGVILGVKISDSHREQVQSWIGKYDHYVDIFQAKLKETEYGIELEKIN